VRLTTVDGRLLRAHSDIATRPLAQPIRWDAVSACSLDIGEESIYGLLAATNTDRLAAQSEL
jgi:hypothetical protein